MINIKVTLLQERKFSAHCSQIINFRLRMPKMNMVQCLDEKVLNLSDLTGNFIIQGFNIFCPSCKILSYSSNIGRCWRLLHFIQKIMYAEIVQTVAYFTYIYLQFHLFKDQNFVLKFAFMRFKWLHNTK